MDYSFASNLIVLRIFRIFAHPQITKFVPNIAISNFSIIKDTGIKILYVTGIIIALTYIYAIIGTILYGETLPAMWGNLGTAFLSMITILLETDAISIFYQGLLDLNRPESLVFIMSYVFIGKLTILNLIIAILIDLLKAREL